MVYAQDDQDQQPLKMNSSLHAVLMVERVWVPSSVDDPASRSTATICGC